MLRKPWTFFMVALSATTSTVSRRLLGAIWPSRQLPLSLSED
jgi:hypothetical protein